MVCGPRISNGKDSLQLLGLLQHLLIGRRNPRARTEYSARDFSFHPGNRRTVHADADKCFRRSAVERSPELAVSGEPRCGTVVRTPSCALHDVDGVVDCAGVRVFLTARLFASALLSSC